MTQVSFFLNTGCIHRLSRTIPYTFFIYFSRILDSPQSRQNAKLLLQSSDGTPPHLLAGEGVGSPNSDEGIDTVVL
jgi:hypothetical protein